MGEGLRGTRGRSKKVNKERGEEYLEIYRARYREVSGRR